MNILDIIDKKEKKQELTYDELKFVVDGFLDGFIKDYQMSAFLTEIDLLGLSERETIDLTNIMLHSGEILDLGNNIVDKHSTGGVGDKTTIVLAPLVASCGVKVAKMSGRGLGHTGGTIDKLESIKGFKTSMTLDKFKRQVDDIGLALVGQMGNLVPADKKLYALRDVTGTVESIPLIASSIMSKKLASGADVIHLDVKVGSGAFMKDIASATKLAELMVQIGRKCGKEVTAILTNMDEPLGLAVGNSLEVIEAINTLNGKGPKDFTELCYTFAEHLIVDAKYANSLEEAHKICDDLIKSGKALDTFAKLVTAQGGDASYVYDPSKFELGKYVVNVLATKSGYVSKIDALAIGNAAMMLGAGRKKIGDEIYHSVGIVLNKKVSDFVASGDVLATIYANKSDVDVEKNMILDAYSISNDKINPKLILKIVK